MILVMLPFFLFAMYQRNGQPLEVFLGHLIQNKFLRPKVRIYQTNNLYSALVRQYELEQEVKKIAGKNGKTRKTAKPSRKLTRAEQSRSRRWSARPRGTGKPIRFRTASPSAICSRTDCAG